MLLKKYDTDNRIGDGPGEYVNSLTFFERGWDKLAGVPHLTPATAKLITVFHKWSADEELGIRFHARCLIEDKLSEELTAFENHMEACEWEAMAEAWIRDGTI